MAGNFRTDPPVEIRPIGVSDIKTRLLKPALTSHYIVNITPPITGFLKQRLGSDDQNKRYDRLSLACVEASLPGSSLATIDIDNDYAGVSEKHGYRRIYDDRIDFTFFVDSDEYYSIRFFEAWIAYVVNEQLSDDQDFEDPNYTYRVNFPGKPAGSKEPGGYYANELSITKFEKDFNLSTLSKRGSGKFLTYKFINAFPISIGSMPVSYEQSSLLKCTVSFSYSRYRIDNGYQQQIVNDQNTTFNNLQTVQTGGSNTTDLSLQQQIGNRRLGL